MWVASGLLWTPLLLPRLVLPYVRHLKGEEDKPLPPSKPRKQYKMAKEPRGDDGATERSKKAKEESRVDQVSVRWWSSPCPAPRSSLCGPLPVLTGRRASSVECPERTEGRASAVVVPGL